MRNYVIEHWRTVHLVDHSSGLMKDEQVMAWVPVGELNDETGRLYEDTVLSTWSSEQSSPPPVGHYRIVKFDAKHPSYQSMVTLELFERTEREIRPWNASALEAVES